MPENLANTPLAKTVVAVVLTFVAGYVDAVGWLALGRVFTGQMSGNLVLLAVHLAAGEEGHALLQATAILAFFAGLVVSGSIIEIGMRRRVRRIFVAALVCEVAMLGVFAAAGAGLQANPHEAAGASGAGVCGLAAIVAFAMGAQNTALRMAGILSVFTTHMTGALTGLSEELIVCGFALLQPRLWRRRGGGFASESLQHRHPDAFRNIRQSAALLAGFFLGALAGALMAPASGVAPAIGVPLLLLVGVAVFDWVVPLTVFPSPVEQE